MPAATLALLRVVTFGTLISFLLQQYDWVVRLDHTHPAFFSPILAFELLHIGPPPEGLLPGLRVAMGVLATLGLVGVAVRLSSAVCALGYLYAVGQLFSFTNVHHGHAILGIALVALACSPGDSLLDIRWPLRYGARFLAHASDPVAGWPLRLVRLEIALVYLLSAYAKLMLTGPGWLDGQVLQWYLTSRGSTLGLWIAEHAALCVFLSIGVFVFEGTFPLVLAFPKLRWLYVPSGILFHIATSVLLVDFRYFWPMLFVFVDPMPLLHRLGAMRRSPPLTTTAAQLGTSPP